jgi:hypothetical protein
MLLMAPMDLSQKIRSLPFPTERTGSKDVLPMEGFIVSIAV